MKVIITAAGASKRFYDAGYTLPKYLLPLDGKTVIDHVISMFDYSDEFLLIVTKQARENHLDFFTKITSNYNNLTILTIESHNFGPCYSIVNQFTTNWLGNSPFIITYCDFFVTWQYKQYLTFLENTNPDANLVTFQGFQPASRGSTLYAYCRTRDLEVLEVREKKSFTNHRESEFASSGIYYFKSWEIFLNCVNASSREFARFGEQYVSLLFNSAVNRNLLVNHYQIEKFICLGTPEDYEEYLYWYEFFNESDSGIYSGKSEIDVRLIPMAGLGERFNRIGIKVPKPFIPIRNKPMFIHALDSQPITSMNLLIIQSAMQARTAQALETFNGKASTVVLSQATSGPGDTILQAKAHVCIDDSVLILSCDYEQRIDNDLFSKLIKDGTFSAGVFYTNFSRYRMKSPQAFAYAEISSNFEVTKIVEKELLSDYPEKDALLVGTFWFKNAKILFDTLEKAKTENRLVNGELYVANALNILIENGLRVFGMPVKKWISYGDPDELEIYNWWESLFLTN